MRPFGFIVYQRDMPAAIATFTKSIDKDTDAYPILKKSNTNIELSYKSFINWVSKTKNTIEKHLALKRGILSNTAYISSTKSVVEDAVTSVTS